MAAITFLLVFLSQFFLDGVRSTDCPDYWTSFDGSCYLFANHHAMPFNKAEAYCFTQHNSSLVHIDNAAENSFVKTYLKKMKDESHWLGLTDQYAEGKYTWNDTGSVVEYADWGSGQPDNYIGGDEDCILYYVDDGFHWHDAPCGHSHEPICETKPDDFGTDNLELIAKYWLSCPNGWLSMNWSHTAKCILFHDVKMSFDEAVTFCESQHDAHLLHVNFAYANSWIKDHASRTSYWVGITDRQTEGVFKDESTGRNQTYFDWAGGQPGDQPQWNEDCVAIFCQEDCKWHDVTCNDRSHTTICQHWLAN